jgi:hypothetical protein
MSALGMAKAFWFPGAQKQVLGRFGEAELLCSVNGEYELRGGSADDRQSAREWTAMFLHEAILPRDELTPVRHAPCSANAREELS